MFEIIAVPAFQDNYIWMLHADGLATVIDPGDAAPVEDALARMNVKLHSILVTHHHSDHIGGIPALHARWNSEIFAPANPRYDFPHHQVREGDTLTLHHLKTAFQVFEIPGHTLDHVAYYGPNRLFCGDTMFGAGCGRLFEGTPQQMLNSLKRLAMLPPETQVYCTHEYTEQNLKFALALTPDDSALQIRNQDVLALRKVGKPSLPSTIGIELSTNPFLRCAQPVLKMAVNMAEQTELEVFTELRQRRNHFD